MLLLADVFGAWFVVRTIDAAAPGPVLPVAEQVRAHTFSNLVATLDRLRSIIAHHTGRPIEQVVDDVGRDRWFDAGEALEHGFVDDELHDPDGDRADHDRHLRSAGLS